MATNFAIVANDTLERWRDARRIVLQRNAGASSIHAWRISTRRLFALEQLLAPPARPHKLRDALQAVFHSAGQLRDAQVTVRLLAAGKDRFPPAGALLRHLRRDLSRLRRHTSRRLRAVRTRHLRKIIDGWRQPRPRAFEVVAQKRATKRLVALQSQPTGLGPLSHTAAAVHRQRLRLKSLRYMIELCRSANCPLPGKQWEPRRLARLQSLLGDITDLQVLMTMIDHRGRRHPQWRKKAAQLRGDVFRRHQRLLARMP